MNLFNRHKTKFEIVIPNRIQQEWFANKVRFVGTKDELFPFIKEFRRLSELDNGDKVKLGKLTLKVSDYITEDRNKNNWIELPNHAWNIMSSKFYDTWEGFDDNPFDFNDCGYTDKNPFDIGIRIVDLPLTDQKLLEFPHMILYKSDWEELYLLIEDTELFDFIDDTLTEKTEIESINHAQSILEGKSHYRINFEHKDKQELIKALNNLNRDELVRIWNLNNKE